mmetsp:Transcript_20173/g.65509  ORF Transcript_20173/g.65509 Transcript_20173/m.65509 type:complete len:113 (+) Transcript_20173:17-355(+)
MRQHSVPMAFRRGTCQPRTNHALEPRLHPSPSSSRGALPCTHTLTPLHPQPRFGAEHLEATLAEGETRSIATMSGERWIVRDAAGRQVRAVVAADAPAEQAVVLDARWAVWH